MLAVFCGAEIGIAVKKKSFLDNLIDNFLPQDIIGLDIGAAYVKLVQLKKKGKSNFSLVRFKVLPVAMPAEGKLDVNDDDEVVIANRDAIKERVRDLFSELKMDPSKIPAVIAVGGKAVVVKRIYVDISGVDKSDMKQTLETEAEQYIPYDVHECQLRFAEIDDAPDEMGKLPFLLMASKKDIVRDYVQIVQEVGGKVECVDAGIISLTNMFELNYEQRGVIGLVNIGATSTNINIMVNGVTFFNREVLKGGIDISASISEKLNMNFDEAENLKIGDQIPQDLEDVLDEVSQVVIGGIKQSFDFFSTTNPDVEVDRIYLTGGSAGLKGLVKNVQEQLEIPTEVIDPFNKISVPRSMEEELDQVRPMLGVCVGLAIRSRSDS